MSKVVKGSRNVKRLITVSVEILVVLVLVWVAPYFTDVSLAGNESRNRATVVTAEGHQIEIEFEEDSEGVLNASNNLNAFSTYSQDFDSLVSSGSGSKSTLPDGWDFVSSSDTTYAANNGSNSSSGIYSFGVTGSTERALGSIDGGSTLRVFGVTFVNNTGRAIKALKISYTGERWRRNTTADRLNFGYSLTNAAFNASSGWTEVDELDFAIGNGSAGAVNGNDAEHSEAISGTVTGLNLANGSSFRLRWNGQSASNQQGLAIDDFTMRPVPVVPETTLLTNPASLTNSTSATFTFSSDDEDATFECSINGLAYSACTSGVTYTDLQDGSRTFAVRAKSSTGTDDSPSTYNWTIDATPPETSLTTTPGLFTGSSATFSFSANETATFDCSLNGGAYSACTSPVNLTGLSEGSNTFRVRGTDALGNVETTPAEYTWTVDATAPGIPTIGIKPSANTNSTVASFTFTGGADNVGGSGFAKYQCKLDSDSYADCVSPIVLTELAEGTRTFSVRAVDVAGNASAADEHEWLVDLTAPGTPTIGDKPNAASNSTSAEFSWTGGSDNVGGSGLARFECKLDSGSWAECTSTKSYSELGEGSHTFYVRSVDNAGNEGVAAEYEWLVDTVAPDAPTIDTNPALNTNQSTASFTFSGGNDSVGGSGFALHECKIDGNDFDTCSSPIEFPGLTEGTHTFSVRSVDVAGNPSSATEYTWKIDVTAPGTPAIGTKPSANTNSTSAEFTFTGGADNAGGSGFDKYECKIDSGSYVECESPVSLTGLAEGTHTFSVRSVDLAGNASDPDEWEWLVDQTAPGIPTIDDKPNSDSNSSSATFTFTGGDDNLNGSGFANYECRLGDGDYETCSSGKTYSMLTDGAYTFYVRSVDNAGNTGDSAEYSWTVDTTEPTLTLEGPTGFINDPAVSFTFSATDANAVEGYQCRFSGGTFANCTSPFEPKPLADGDYTFEVKATDAAGNESFESLSFTVDTVAPVISEVSTPEEIANNTPTMIFVGVGDLNPIDSVKLFYTSSASAMATVLGGGIPDPFVTCSLAAEGPQKVSPPENGAVYECEIPALTGPTFVTFYVEATDGAGNSSNNPAPSVPNAFAIRGADGESAPLPPGPFNSLTIDGDIELEGDVEVQGVLTIVGPSEISGGKIVIGCEGSILRVDSDSFIIGEIEKDFCETGTFTYPIGVNEPGVNLNPEVEGGLGAASPGYAPVTVTVTALNGPSSLAIEAVGAPMAGTAPTHYIGIHWRTVETGDITADIRFAWDPFFEVGNPAYYSGLRRTPLSPTSGFTEVVETAVLDTENREVEFFGVTVFDAVEVDGLDSNMSSPVILPFEWTAGLIGTSAGSSELSGRVVSHLGQGLKDVFVTVTGGNLATPVMVRTNQFGSYRFNGLEAGATYVVTVTSQRHSFGMPTRVIYLADSLGDENFVADPR
jgi:hypothetical protein